MKRALNEFDSQIHQKQQKVSWKRIQVIFLETNDKILSFKFYLTEIQFLQCARQPDNIVCGFYVIRFMREIVTSQMNPIPENV